MFKELLQRDNTKEFINNLYTYEIYKDREYSNYELIGMFYDAVYKYSLIIDNIEYYDNYLVELDLLFRRVEKEYSIKDGITKLLSKILVNKVNVKDKEEFIRYIYYKYIENGYFIHAYSPVYTESIKNNGFKINKYTNLYNDFIVLKEILNKYKDNYISKDFNLDEVVFTDSMELAYFYSLRSPMYFYELICGDEHIKNKDSYLMKDYNSCLNNINKVIKTLNISSEDSTKLIDIFNREWKLLNNDNSINSSFILVKRDLILDDKLDLNKLIDEFKSEDYYIIMDRLINNNYNNVICKKDIDSADIEFLTIENRCENKNKSVDELVINSDGVVSTIIIIGSILMTLGVVVTLILFL